MLNLISTSDKVQVGTSSSADLEVRADWMEATTSSGIITADTFKPDNQHTAIATSPGPTDIIAAPASNRSRAVSLISIRNKHASTANTLTVQIVNASSTKELIKATLAAGEELVFKDGTWFVYDTNGAVKAGATAMSDTVAGIVAAAVQSDMESGSSTTLCVTPGRQHFHPGHPKCWGKCTNSGGTPTLQTSYNMTSITDTNTDQLTITIANDFSSANYSLVAGIEAATTTLSATTTSLFIFIRNATQAAGSAILQSCEIDVGAATDPSAWHWVGLGDL